MTIKIRERKEFNLAPHNAPNFVKCNNTTVVGKGWGRVEDGVGEVFAFHKPHEHQDINVETVKILHIAKGKKLSRHFHIDKKEFFILACGNVTVEIWDRDGDLYVVEMRQDNKIFIAPGIQHRITGNDDVNILVEVSTLDNPSDSYRIEKGD